MTSGAQIPADSIDSVANDVAGVSLYRQGTPPIGDAAFRLLATASGASIVVMIALLVMVLAHSAMPSFKTFGVKFLTTSTWRPNELVHTKRTPTGKIVRDADGEPVTETIPPVFGAAPVIFGTAVSSALALFFAIPLSFGAALFLVRIAPRWMVPPASFLIEFLAAIPSIAYGLWGLFVLSPVLQSVIEPALNAMFARIGFLRVFHADALSGRDMLCAGLIVAIMIVPIITAISRDVLRAVPRTQIEGTMALGATWWQSAWGMLRYARSGLFGAVMLGLARAAGETMAVAMVIGNVPEIHATPFAAAQTMA
ncbi:MAG TPA: phosphate ABC transporter permease subunit PstC, partial [Humisphaera sp.]|nr:phosphate ABC transporter permease subunit PstC [Humisphaera sp.]